MTQDQFPTEDPFISVLSRQRPLIGVLLQARIALEAVSDPGLLRPYFNTPELYLQLMQQSRE